MAFLSPRTRFSAAVNSTLKISTQIFQRVWPVGCNAYFENPVQISADNSFFRSCIHFCNDPGRASSFVEALLRSTWSYFLCCMEVHPLAGWCWMKQTLVRFFLSYNGQETNKPLFLLPSVSTKFAFSPSSPPPRFWCPLGSPSVLGVT